MLWPERSKGKEAEDKRRLSSPQGRGEGLRLTTRCPVAVPPGWLATDVIGQLTRILSVSRERLHRQTVKAMKQQLKFIESKSILLKVKIQSQMGEWASSRGSCTALLWVWGFYVLISLRDGIFIMLGDLCRKKMVSLTIRKTIFFLPCLVLTELSWFQMHNGYSVNCNANLF